MTFEDAHPGLRGKMFSALSIANSVESLKPATDFAWVHVNDIASTQIDKQKVEGAILKVHKEFLPTGHGQSQTVLLVLLRLEKELGL